MRSDGQDAASDSKGADGDALSDNRVRGAVPGRKSLPLGLKGVVGASSFLSVVSLAGIALRQGDALFPVLPGLAAALFVYFCAIAALVFSLRLAVLASAWLALCFLWGFGLASIVGIDLVPETIAAVFAVNAVNALVVAHLVYGVTVEVWRDMKVDAAIRKGLGRWAAPGAVAVAAILASLLVLAPLEPVWIRTLFATSLCAVAASAATLFLGLPVSLRQNSFDESSIPLANRHRERHENMIVCLAVTAAPRWAYAVLGTSFVFSAILISQGGRAADLTSAPVIQLWWESGAALGLSIVVAGLIGAVTGRNWRAAAVCMVAPFLLATWAAAICYHLQIASLAISAKFLVIGGGFGTGLCVLLVDAIGVHRRIDDDVETAIAHALNESGPVIAIMGLAIAVAAAVIAIQFVELSPAILVVLVEIVGVLVLVPGLVSVIEDIFPRRKNDRRTLSPRVV